MKKFTEWTPKLIGRIARRFTGANNAWPIDFVDGNISPQLTGEFPYYTTPTGKLVKYPGAYHWPTVYHGSTVRIVIGRSWSPPRPPKGYSFSFDGGLGLCVIRNSDGMDFHPSREDILAKNFCYRVKRQMAENWKKRQIIKREQKLFASQTKNTWVTLQDSITAGNCIEGSLAFAERRLKIPREEILAGGKWLYKVSAKRLLDTHESRAIAAVHVAWKRETTISI